MVSKSNKKMSLLRDILQLLTAVNMFTDVNNANAAKTFKSSLITNNVLFSMFLQLLWNNHRSLNKWTTKINERTLVLRKSKVKFCNHNFFYEDLQNEVSFDKLFIFYNSMQPHKPSFLERRALLLSDTPKRIPLVVLF